ncbi:MAG: PIN domain-containing protein [Victivallales bacterium]
MKSYLFDTSVLVAAILEKHPKHEKAFRWLKAASNGKIGFYISSHTLAELYSVLTGMPSSPKISPSQAKLLIEKNTQAARIIDLNEKDYWAVIVLLSDLNLSGGVIYDALSAYAARKAKADHILTFNENDFKRFELKQDIPKTITPFHDIH